MSSQPPRRRRSGSDEEERGGGLPMVPIFAGVIVAGLGIGALLSAFASRRAPAPAPSATAIVVEHTPTPIVQRRVAVATAPPSTAPPTAKPRPTPAPKPTATRTEPPSPKPTTKPTPTPAPKPTATRTEPPSPKPTTKPTPRPPTIAPVAIRTAAPLRTTAPVRTAPPIPPPSAPRVAQVATPVPADPIIGNSQSLVRRYLDAVAHGDDAGAYSALGGQSGNRLVEQQFLDPSMRITTITASPNAGGGAKVQVELSTAKGQYFGTYTVDSNGTRITEHAIIPVGGTTSR